MQSINQQILKFKTGSLYRCNANLYEPKDFDIIRIGSVLLCVDVISEYDYGNIKMLLLGRECTKCYIFNPFNINEFFDEILTP